MQRGSVLVAPLNWGLGHATRCIPVINQLKSSGFTPIIASDGIALELLKKEFPNLTHYELPGIDIQYAKKGVWFKFKLFTQLNQLNKCIRKEQTVLKQIIEAENLVGIISDNRLGLFHAKIPCVIISHQLNVLSGNTTWLTSRMHMQFLKKYNQCWVPDLEDDPNLSGRLGHVQTKDLTVKYVGVLSRFTKRKVAIEIDILIVLSGPEPQRTLLEELLIEKLKDEPQKIVMVRGKIEDVQKRSKIGNITVFNFAKAKVLEELILKSELVVARSGYTTLMDLAKLDKKAFFIPTPGQTEQEYLANRLEGKRIAPYIEQHKFEVSQLKRVKGFKGLGSIYRDNAVMPSKFFSLFDGK